jgi:hypothetical protein
MKNNKFTQLTLNFDQGQGLEEKPVDLATPPFEKKVLYLAPYIESKKQDRTARLYQNIFDSIKHLG